MSPNANLYLDKIDYGQYRGDESCQTCNVESFTDFLDKIRAGDLPAGACVHWPEKRLAALRQAATADKGLPEVPMLDVPRPADPGLIPWNEPDEGSALLITGNSEFTQAVMLAVISLTKSPLHLLSVDTKGHTVDMAMVFKELTAEKVAKAVNDEALEVKNRRVIIPGLAKDISGELSGLLGCEVEVGPVCAAELPLYMGGDWAPAT